MNTRPGIPHFGTLFSIVRLSENIIRKLKFKEKIYHVSSFGKNLLKVFLLAGFRCKKAGRGVRQHKK